MIRVTIACPETLIDDANQLASVLGYSADDARTFGAAFYRDGAGNRYAVASTLAAASFPVNAAGPLIEPAWGADMAAAARAQALLRIGGPAAPDALVAVIDADPQAALTTLGVTVQSSSME